jgi:hypothetical protein
MNTLLLHKPVGLASGTGLRGVKIAAISSKSGGSDVLILLRVMGLVLGVVRLASARADLIWLTGLSFYRSVSCITAMLLGEFVDRTRPWSLANLGVGTFGGVVYVVEVLVTLVGLFRGARIVLVGSGIP